jgi:hypothetical protein
MRPLTEQQFRELAAALLTQARATAPEWTEHNAFDREIIKKLAEMQAFCSYLLQSAPTPS